MEAMHLCLQRRGLSSVLPGFLSIRDDAVSLSWVGDYRPVFVRHARTTGVEEYQRLGRAYVFL